MTRRPALLPCALACLLAVLLLRPAAPARAQEGPFDPGGRWEGRVLFARGHEARAELVLEPDGAGSFAGEYALVLATEDAPERRGGRLRATPAGDRLRIELILGDAPARRAKLVAEGRRVDAGSHARDALLGEFSGPEGEGVFLLWRYGP